MVVLGGGAVFYERGTPKAPSRALTRGATRNPKPETRNPKPET
jgi:hypothetical protein